MKSWIFEHGRRGLMLVLPAAAVTAASLWTLVSVTLEAAAGSAPGDLLYPAREQALYIQLDLTTDPAERAALALALGHLAAADTQGRSNSAPPTTPEPIAAGHAGGSTWPTRPDRIDASRESEQAAHRVPHPANVDENARAADEPTANPTLHSGGKMDDDVLAQGVGVVDIQVVAETDGDDQDIEDSNDDLDEDERGDDDIHDEE